MVLITSSAFAGLVAPILAAIYWERSLFRYQLTFYTMPIIILVWLLCGILRNRVWTLISGSAVLVAIIIAENATSARQRSRVLNPAFVEVAEALERLPADLALAEYWSTTPTYIASGRQLMVCPIRAEAFLHMIANYGWCDEGLDRWARRHNWLVIAMNERLDRDAIVEAYGPPDRQIARSHCRIINCGSIHGTSSAKPTFGALSASR